MPDSPDIAADVMKGLQVGSNIWQAHANANAKQQQMENQLASYALRAQQMQQSSEMREAQFQMSQDKLKWDMDKFKSTMDWNRAKEQDAAKDRDRAADARDWGLQIKENKADQFVARKADEAQASQGFWSEIALLDSKPGTDQYNLEVPKIAAKYAHFAPAIVDDLASKALIKSNQARDTMQRGYEAEVRDWNNRVGQTLGYGGNTLEQNVPVIMHPENFLKDQKAGGYFDTSFGAQPTGKKIYTTSTGQEKVVEPADIAKLQSDWNSIQTRKPGAPVHQPDIGVVPASGGVITVKTSSGKTMPIYAKNLQQAKERDPGLTVITGQ